MPVPAIIRGSDHFFGTIYEGNGGGQKVGNFVPFTDSGTIAKSCIFNNTGSASAHYLRNSSLSEGNNQIATFSAWIRFTGPFSTSSDLYTNNGGIIEQGNGNWSSTAHFMFWTSRGRLNWYHNGTTFLMTNRYLQDSSKWYHIMWTLDVTESTASDRLKIYIDGDEVTSFSTDNRSSLTQDTDLSYINVSGQELNIGGMPSGNGYQDLNCYMAEVNYIDGTAYGPSTFGLTDTSTGRWIPKTLSGITYGTNGFRLTFANTAGLTIGDDTSGNENDFTISNIATTDITTDSPTQNFPVLDSSKSALTLSEGNTIGTSPGTGVKFAFSQMTFDPFDSTGYYMEFKLIQHTYCVVGFRLDEKTVSTTQSYQSVGYVAINSSNDWYVDNVKSFDGSDVFANDDIVGVYIKNGKIYYSINGTMQNSSNYVASFKPGRYRITMGHNANYSPYASAQMICPQSKWNYTPSGVFADYREIQQDNLTDTELNKPDISWFYNRDSTDSNSWYDSNRGPLKRLVTDTNAAQTTVNDGLQKFIKGGCEIEDDAAINSSNESFINWNWVVNGGTTETNDDGSTDVTLQKNVTAGISIGTFKSTSGAQTLGHGLGVAPDAIIMKCTSASQNWMVYHKDLDPTDSHYLHLNNTDSEQTGSDFNNTLPTSTVFSANPTGVADRDYIFYAFKGIPGFSKFGTYTGNGVVDGPFIHLGFKPRWFMHKANNGASWYIYDTIRENNYNEILYASYAGVTTAESSNIYGYDFLSNGVKVRNPNGYGGNYPSVEVFYFAFAEHPFIGDGVSPATAV